ncbi:hypothetical protein D3879_15700 [Pseudomonas cavernicola]|uniref:Uncharacterized protein n=1 Tax=Pseudomonas cavernicola TaxID=2320866 RepID=A0A418XFC1_9PSED|nr:helix-turn-helix domain-containing protein [Pseudomonas cavernicola]RJG11103.1 hypothetical protein D3879_15700 [Pseudomonas cavernicola]
MPGKQKTPDQSAQAVILREAGYTLPAIADRLSISLSTTQRLLKRNGAVAGAATQALIEKARDEMLSSAFALESVQQTAASLVLEDLAVCRQIRMTLSSALEQLDTSNPIVFRALAASATALKLTQDVGRRALPLDKLNQSMEVDELPELQIHIMTEADVEEVRAQQRLEEAEINGTLDDALETQRWLAYREEVKAQQADDDVIEEC